MKKERGKIDEKRERKIDEKERGKIDEKREREN
jgi:hypothetical protein